MSASKIVMVTTESMMNDALFRSMKSISATGPKYLAMQASVAAIIAERVLFESKVERTDGQGNKYVGQSNDIKHLTNLIGKDSVIRMLIAQKIDPRAYFHPVSKGGKDSSETSNLKGYEKFGQICDAVWIPESSRLQGVAKVFVVCAWKAVQTSSCVDFVLDRKYAEYFLNSHEFRSIRLGTQELFDAIDGLRKIEMTGGGAKTQASQMIRTLVAMKSATDVQNGRSKDTRIDPNGRVIQALMRRYGQVTDTVDLINLVTVTEEVSVSQELELLDA